MLVTCPTHDRNMLIIYKKHVQIMSELFRGHKGEAWKIVRYILGDEKKDPKRTTVLGT